MVGDRLIWSDDPVHTGTQTMVITAPELSEKDLKELRTRWVDKYAQPAGGFGIPSGFWNDRPMMTHMTEVLTGDSADMVERAKAAARE